MESVSSIANAVGGKTARACDSCIRKRARWYCAADDAFLCQSCDATVHSANPLAKRHERVRLKTSSLRFSLENSFPSWHKGFAKKARTPRHAKQQKQFHKEPRKNLVPSVPEVSVDENSSHEGNEEHELLFRVPSCDPFLSKQFCLSGNSKAFDHASTSKSNCSNLCANDGHEVESLHGLIDLPSELDMAEFAADVESLLGKGLDEDCYGIESLGIMEEFNSAKNSNSLEFSYCDDEKIKLEEENSGNIDNNQEIQMEKDQFEISFDYESIATCCNEEAAKVEKKDTGRRNEERDESSYNKRVSLSLDYEAIISAWSNYETPWFSGDSPHVDLDECWPDYMGTWGTEVPQIYGGLPGMGRQINGKDMGREARVSRYREKRRNRLFSKKIRYEVRKLNAEKRPRMKGRFVKRAAFQASSVPFTILNNI